MGTSKDNSLTSVYVWNQMSLGIKEQFDIDTLAPRKEILMAGKNV